MKSTSVHLETPGHATIAYKKLDRAFPFDILVDLMLANAI